METYAHRAAVALHDIRSRFAASDAFVTMNRAQGAELQAERTRLTLGINALIAAGDYETLAEQATRIADIGRELVRIGQ
jgi:hypothetical protein